MRLVEQICQLPLVLAVFSSKFYKVFDMGLRPGRCYSSTKDRPYTRQAVTVHDRNYIGAVPGLKTRQFNMGDGMKQFDTVVDLHVETGPLGMQIRDNAIESARLMVNRTLIKQIGKEGFFLKLRIYPHHILRENKQAQGAHADRIQKGMSHAFGKVIGRAARIRNGQIVFSVLTFEADAEKAVGSLMRANNRFPCRVHTTIHKDVASIGTKPKKTRDIAQEEQAAKEAAATAEAGAAAAAAEAAPDAKGGAKAAETKPAAGAKKEEKKK